MICSGMNLKKIYPEYCFYTRADLYGLRLSREIPMGKAISIGHVLAWPFLLPGNIACDALGLREHRNLVRMLVNSLIWTVLGVIVVALAV